MSADFDAFWDRTLAEARTHDLAPELTRAGGRILGSDGRFVVVVME
ncbi:hypothetical protein AB0L65_46605 [Nonomuraea sp. NPDC052116]